jgi:hypothetical protein
VYKELKWIEKDPCRTSFKKQKEREKCPCGFLGKGGSLINMCGIRDRRNEMLMKRYRYNT